MVEKTVVVQARVAPELKQKTEKVFREIGFDMASAIRLFLVQVERTGDLPFTVSQLVDVGAAATGTRKAATRRVLSKPYHNVREMVDAILGTDHA